MPDSTDKELPVREFTITRQYDATRELIWSALTDPEQLSKFWGPVGTTVPVSSVSIDPRVGGDFRALMVLIEDGTEYPMDAVYREFIEPERMVFETAGGIIGTIELTDLGSGRTEFKWTTCAAFDDELLENATIGTNSAADQLGAHLAAIQG